jgi:hypothetical protein
LVRAALLGAAFAFASSAAAAPSAEEVERAVRQLGDDRFEVREQATAFLRKAGPAARPALQKALKDGDREVVLRARRILRELRLAITPDRPKAVVDLLRDYYAGADPKEKEKPLIALADWGKPGHLAIRDLLEDDDDRAALDHFFSRLAYRLDARTPAYFVSEGRLDDAALVLHAGFGTKTEPDARVQPFWIEYQARNLAAFHFFRGSLKEPIAEFKARLPREVSEIDMAIGLAWMYRLKADRGEAVRAARQAKIYPALLRQLLREQGAWDELAKEYADGETGYHWWWDRTDRLRLKAACNRLAGRDKEWRKALDSLLEAARKTPADDDAGFVSRAAGGLILNDRPSDDILALLRERNDRDGLFEFLCARYDFRSAFTLAAEMESNRERSFHRADPAARALISLGERERAARLLNDASRRLPSDPKSFSGAHSSCVWDERAMGLREEALDHCRRLLPHVKERGERARRESGDEDQFRRDLVAGCLGDGYDQQATAAVWHDYLRKELGDVGALDRTADLLAGRVKPDELEALVWKAERRLVADLYGAPGSQLHALLDVCLAAGREDLAKKFAERGAEEVLLESVFVRLGDWAAAKGRWTEAVRWYDRAWEFGPREAEDIGSYYEMVDPTPFYLSGYARLRAGQEKEGRRRMELAHWLALGDERARFRFARGLARRGHTEAALKEYQLALRFGTGARINDTLEGLTALAREGSGRGDFAAAAESYEHARLLLLEHPNGRNRIGRLLLLSHHVHHQRALAHLAAGRLKEGRAEVRMCLDLLPGNIELAADVVPLLEAKGLQEEADELFDAAFAVHARICSSYPRCAWARHDLAWLCVRCRRRLDDALCHARRATVLEPGRTDWLDTLAEAHFQRGDKARALRLNERCVERESGRAYYQEQRARFEKGERNSPPPPREWFAAPRTQQAWLVAEPDEPIPE